MELAVIRVKRTLDTEPLEEIALESKRFKLDSNAKLQSVATLQGKDEPLEKVLQNIVAKFRRQKAERHHERTNLSYSQLYKHKTSKVKSSAAQHAQSVADNRYQITSKARGLATQLDPETEKFLCKAEQFSLKIEGADEEEARTSATAADNTAGEAAAGGLGIQVVDVDHCSVKDINKYQADVISMNGVPLEECFVYDIFITRVPKGYSIDELIITDVASVLEDEHYSESEGEASDDSNAENNYRNDYPDEESEEDNSLHQDNKDHSDDDFSAITRDDYWDDPLVDMMRTTSLGESSEDQEQLHILGEPVPPYLAGLLNWRGAQHMMNAADTSLRSLYSDGGDGDGDGDGGDDDDDDSDDE